MTKERIILLTILEIMVFAFILQFGLSTLGDKKVDYEDKILLNSKLIERLEETKEQESYQSQERKEEVHFLYSKFNSQENLYLFGIRIKDMLLSQGINITRYQQVSSSSGDQFEYNLEGTPRKILNFLILLSQEDFLVQSESLNIDSQRTPTRITLRIASTSLPEGIEPPPPLTNEMRPSLITYEHSPQQISRIFPSSYVYTPRTSTSEPVTTAPVRVPRKNIDYVGSVKTMEEGIKHSFKDNSTGGIFILSPTGVENSMGWSLKEITTNSFILYNEGNRYEVNK